MQKKSRGADDISEKREIITVREVANRAGVSVGTVSRYLNGYTLREKNLSRVERAIRELGYKENFIAKGMKTGKTHTVGVLFSGLDEFHASMLSALEKIFSRRGYFLVVCDYESDPEILQRKASFLIDRNVDALIVSPAPEEAGALREIREAGVPIVFFNDSLPGFSADHVASDGFEAMRKATEYLLHMNHRRIALINGPQVYSTALDRLRGYRQAFKDAGLATDRGLVREGRWNDSSGGHRAGNELLSLSDPPTAVLCGNFHIGVGLLRAVRQRGLRIPQDVSLVSYDDGDLFELSRPGITAIRQPIRRMADAIAELVLKRLSGNDEDFPSHNFLDTQFILRESVSRHP